MTELALQISRYSTVLGTSLSSSYQRVSTAVKIHRLPKEIAFIGSLLILIQLLDAVFTGFGVSIYGTVAEGNPVIRHLMENIGIIQALIVVKLVAIVIILSLCSLASQITWVLSAMRAVAVLYIGGALIPWAAILFRHIA